MLAFALFAKVFSLLDVNILKHTLFPWIIVFYATGLRPLASVTLTLKRIVFGYPAVRGMDDCYQPLIS